MARVPEASFTAEELADRPVGEAPKQEGWGKLRASTVCAPISDRACRLHCLLIALAWNGVVDGTKARRKGLAGKLGWSLDKFDRAAKELVDAGYVQRDKCRNADGWQDANRWVLLTPEAASPGAGQPAAPGAAHSRPHMSDQLPDQPPDPNTKTGLRTTCAALAKNAPAALDGGTLLDGEQVAASRVESEDAGEENPPAAESVHRDRDQGNAPAARRLPARYSTRDQKEAHLRRRFPAFEAMFESPCARCGGQIPEGDVARWGPPGDEYEGRHLCWPCAEIEWGWYMECAQ